MSQPPQVTSQQIAAAKLRIVLDRKLGRQTPELVRRIAEMPPAFLDEPTPPKGMVIQILGRTEGDQDSAIRAILDEHSALRTLVEASQAPSEKPRRDPNPLAMSSLGALLVNQGRAEEAEQWYRRAIDLGDTTALTNLADLLADQDRLGEAEQWYRRAIDAGDTTALTNLATLLTALDRQGEPKNYFAARSKPTSRNADKRTMPHNLPEAL